MQSYTNEHGEKVTVIGTVIGARPGDPRREIKIVEFVCCGSPCFALKGIGGQPDARRFSTQVRRAKSQYSHPSLSPEWFI